jgi:hypothetical protein
MTGGKSMLPASRRKYSVLQQLLGLATALLGAYFIWWLLNMAFPDKMHALIAAVRAAL